MGNSPSAARPVAGSPAGFFHGASGAPTVRREPKLRDSIQAQRVAAPPEPSLAQARGTSVIHGSRKSHSQSHTQSPSHSQSHHTHTGTASPTRDQMNGQQSKTSEPKSEVRDQPSKPVAVPAPTITSNLGSASLSSPYSFSMEPSAPPADAMSYHLTRPPRLPLPIEEEVHTPGSPIIAPADAAAPLLDIEALEADSLPRRSSALSSTTAEDEEDVEELPIDKTNAVVPTEFEWLGGGEKVYVTGTIFQWSRKSKLHRVPDRPGAFTATISVSPGTHHIRFIVDGNMTVSPDLPTTVDFGNNLVNYIEVSANDIPRDTNSSVEARGTLVLSGEKKVQSGSTQSRAKEAEEGTPVKPVPRMKPALPATRYTSNIPQYLIDLDKAEESSAYQYAAAAIDNLPPPPSLPGFLGKPILNAATPMKDDNSVLNMPNHTVLNHLATSSIKNNVLAVSATTRYKHKYVTTIMYKPTTDDAS